MRNKPTRERLYALRVAFWGWRLAGWGLAKFFWQECSWEEDLADHVPPRDAAQTNLEYLAT